MHQVGTIVRLQIQRASLKTGEKPNRVYDPAPILAVDRLAVSPDGVLGGGPGGGWLVRVHHRAPPSTKNEGGLPGASVGVTAPYPLIRARVGKRVAPRFAGVNILACAGRRGTPVAR